MMVGILAASCASLLPGLGFDTLRFGLETFVCVTQTGRPKGRPDWSAGRELTMLLPIRGAWSPRPRLRRSETSEHSLPILRLGVSVTLQALE